MTVSQVKCEQYWPDEGEKFFGDIKVMVILVEKWAAFELRTLSISKVSIVFIVVNSPH